MKSKAFNRIIASVGIMLAIIIQASAEVAGRQATKPVCHVRSQGAAQRREAADDGRQSRLELAKGGGQVGRQATGNVFGGGKRRVLLA